MSGARAKAVIPGAEPISAAGGPDGVLVLHGFTGNPHSMRPLAERFAADGYAVELPLLPGHGTALEDMIPTRWRDWSSAAEEAYRGLSGRCERVAIAALSMGGSLAAWLAIAHPEIAGLVVVNPLIDPPATSFREALSELLAGGTEVVPAIGSDIADPDSHESSYPGTPVAAALSLFEGLDGVAARLGDIRCPVLIFTSTQDHVVPPTSSDVLAAGVSGPVERVTLARSYHVATLDYDAGEIESRASDWVAKLFAGDTAKE
jgi:carboxylesterase